MGIIAKNSLRNAAFSAEVRLPLLLDGADIADGTVKADTSMVNAVCFHSALRYAARLWYLICGKCMLLWYFGNE